MHNKKTGSLKVRTGKYFVSQVLSVRSRKCDGKTRLILSPTFSLVQNQTLEVP